MDDFHEWSCYHDWKYWNICNFPDLESQPFVDKSQLFHMFCTATSLDGDPVFFGSRWKNLIWKCHLYFSFGSSGCFNIHQKALTILGSYSCIFLKAFLSYMTMLRVFLVFEISRVKMTINSDISISFLHYELYWTDLSG